MRSLSSMVVNTYLMVTSVFSGQPKTTTQNHDSMSTINGLSSNPSSVPLDKIKPFMSLRSMGQSVSMGSLGDMRVFSNGAKPSNFAICFKISTELSSQPQEVCIDPDENILGHPTNLTLMAELTKSFNHKRRTIIIIPGYRSRSHMSWIEKIRELWHQYSNYNVVSVNWEVGANGLYRWSATNTRLVSHAIHALLYYLCQVHNCNYQNEEFLDNLHLVGHSLGAHIAGFVGQQFGPNKVDRITALEPAGPNFDCAPEADRLDPSDAKLVDVFHTNGGSFSYFKVGLCMAKRFVKKLWPFGRGKPEACRLSPHDYDFENQPPQDDTIRHELKNYVDDSPDCSDKSIAARTYFGISHRCGHIDYYANDGKLQPGCETESSLVGGISCSHGRAIELYINTLERQLEVQSRGIVTGRGQKTNLRRLIAFQSKDFESFVTGYELRDLLSSRTEDGTFTEAFEESLTNLSIPIDLTSSGKNLRQEVSRSYKLMGVSQNDHYFVTGAKAPFMASHSLAILRISRPQWHSGCKLSMFVAGTSGNHYMLAELRGKSVSKFFSRANGSTIILPVINNNADMLTAQGKRILSTTPAQINLTFSSLREAGLASRISGTKIGKFFERNPDRICKLDVESLELLDLTWEPVNSESLKKYVQSDCQTTVESLCFRQKLH